MMHRDHFIRRRKERLQQCEAVRGLCIEIRSRIQFSYDEQTVFCTPRDIPLQFLSMSEILVQRVKAPLNNVFPKSSIVEVGKRCK